MFKQFMYILFVLALVMVSPIQVAPTASAQSDLCTLIAVDRPAEPGGDGEGMGGMYRGYFTAGTVIYYEMDYDGPDGGAGFRVWSGLVDPDTAGSPLFEDGGGVPFSNSYTIPADGNYTVDAGAGGTGEGGMVHVLVQATCDGGGETDYLCTPIGTVSGMPEGGSSPISLEAGTLVTIVAEQSDPACRAEGNLHFGSCEGPLVAQASGIGSGQATLVIDEGGTYELCIGGSSDGCAETTVTITAYASCSRPPLSACPLTIPGSAVMGKFISDARLYYSPDKVIVPAASLSTGQSAYVLGVNSTGAYYKIIWVCQYLWVPVETMGPNYDPVWGGRPLPTDVVH